MQSPLEQLKLFLRIVGLFLSILNLLKGKFILRRGESPHFLIRTALNCYSVMNVSHVSKFETGSAMLTGSLSRAISFTFSKTVTTKRIFVFIKLSGDKIELITPKTCLAVHTLFTISQVSENTQRHFCCQLPKF